MVVVPDKAKSCGVTQTRRFGVCSRRLSEFGSVESTAPARIRALKWADRQVEICSMAIPAFPVNRLQKTCTDRWAPGTQVQARLTSDRDIQDLQLHLHRILFIFAAV
jgi:hypothetical protein